MCSLSKLYKVVNNLSCFFSHECISVFLLFAVWQQRCIDLVIQCFHLTTYCSFNPKLLLNFVCWRSEKTNELRFFLLTFHVLSLHCVYKVSFFFLNQRMNKNFYNECLVCLCCSVLNLARTISGYIWASVPLSSVKSTLQHWHCKNCGFFSSQSYSGWSTKYSLHCPFFFWHTADLFQHKRKRPTTQLRRFF